MAWRRKLAVALVVALMPMVSAGAGEEIRDLIFVAGPTGGNWANVQPVMVHFLEQDLPGVSVTALGGGSVANVRNINDGSAEFGFSHGFVFSDAVQGIGEFEEEGALDNIAILTATARSYFYPVARAASDVKTLEDIAHCNWNPGAAGGGIEVAARMMLESSGITYDMIRANGKTVNFQPYSNASELMKDGHVDAVMIAGMLPNGNVMEMESSFPIRIIPLEGPGIDKLVQVNKAFTKDVMPANTYKDQTEELPILAFYSVMAVRRDLSEDFVYSLTKSIYENRKAMAEVVAENDFIEGANVLVGYDNKYLHPGAAKYYREIGIIK